MAANLSLPKASNPKKACSVSGNGTSFILEKADLTALFEQEAQMYIEAEAAGTNAPLPEVKAYEKKWRALGKKYQDEINDRFYSKQYNVFLGEGRYQLVQRALMWSREGEYAGAESFNDHEE